MIPITSTAQRRRYLPRRRRWLAVLLLAAFSVALCGFLRSLLFLIGY